MQIGGTDRCVRVPDGAVIHVMAGGLIDVSACGQVCGQAVDKSGPPCG